MQSVVVLTKDGLFSPSDFSLASSSNIGAAINSNAMQNNGQLNVCGKTFRNAFTPPSATRIESAMNTYSAIATPKKFNAHAFHSEPSRARSIRQLLTRVPHRIMSNAIETGAITGPHHGSGSKKRRSQSSSECGQPHITFRKT